jgi:hypothetical protein
MRQCRIVGATQVANEHGNQSTMGIHACRLDALECGAPVFPWIATSLPAAPLDGGLSLRSETALRVHGS